MSLKKSFQLVCHELVWAPLLSVFIGLFIDFRGMSSDISEAMPILKAFIPVVSLYGIVFCTILVLLSLPRVFHYFNALRPSIKFGKQYHTLLDYRNKVWSFQNHVRNYGEPPYALQVEIATFLGANFGIKCTETQNTKAWYDFLVLITACSMAEDLHSARKIGEDYYVKYPKESM